ncbi:MAG TPA: helix-hairpin-helix domain-containing protein [Verrucomicrobiae bacterium]|nr:helix-hairpin-helix domain-containing protein [Verrucomicrobiae bacterium]
MAFGQQSGNRQVFHPSKICPECGSKLFKEAGVNDEDDDVWRCPNPDCPAQIRERLEHWCSRDAMDIEGGHKDFVAQLVKSGLVRDVAELYQLKLREIVTLEGMDEKSAQDFLNALTASKKREACRVLYGLAIPHVSTGAAKSLCGHFPSLDLILGTSAGQLTEVQGISEVIAQEIVYWYGDGVNRKLIERLRKAGLNFKT